MAIPFVCCRAPGFESSAVFSFRYRAVRYILYIQKSMVQYSVLYLYWCWVPIHSPLSGVPNSVLRTSVPPSLVMWPPLDLTTPYLTFALPDAFQLALPSRSSLPSLFLPPLPLLQASTYYSVRRPTSSPASSASPLNILPGKSHLLRLLPLLPILPSSSLSIATFLLTYCTSTSLVQPINSSIAHRYNVYT